MNERFVVDADGHVMEPGDLWQRHVAPGYRERAIRVERDRARGDRLLIDGAASRLVPRLGGVRPLPGRPPVNWNYLNDLDHYEPYHDSCLPASYAPEARLRWMDEQGIDVSVLFPSLGLIWPREAGAEPEYVRAHMWAYDRWIAAFCSVARERLVPVAQIAMGDVDSAVADLAELREAGFTQAMLPWTAPGAPPPFTPHYDRFWAAVRDLGFVIHLHKAAMPHLLGVPPGRPLGARGTGRFFAHVHETLPAQLCLAGVMDAALLDRFPEIRLTFLECNAGWLPAWLERAEESFAVLASHRAAPLAHPPRHYVEQRDQLFFCLGMAEDPEPLLRYSTRLLIATDFPHPDAPLETMAAWHDRLRELPADAIRRLTGGNALRMLGRDEATVRHAAAAVETSVPFRGAEESQG